MSIIESTIFGNTFSLLPQGLKNKFLRFAVLKGRKQSSLLSKILIDANRKGKTTSRISCYSTIYGGQEKFNDKKLRYLMADSLELLHDFIIEYQIEQDVLHKNLLLIKGLKSLGLNKEMQRITKNAKNQLGNYSFRNSDFHYHKYQILKQSIQNEFENKRRGGLDISSMSEALFHFHETEKAQTELSIVTHEVHNQEAVALSGFLSPESAIIYRNLKEILVKPDSEKYNYLKALIKSISIFPQEEYREILLHIINYCIRAINRKEIGYLVECYDWYTWGLENGILLDKGYLSKYTFKNIITLCIKSKGDLDPMESLESLAKYLHPSIVSNVVAYNLARIYFDNKEYDLTMDTLNQIIYDDLLDELDGRRMLMRIYFEEEEWNVLDSFLISFDAFIRRQRNLGYHKEYYLNLVKYVKRAINIHRMTSKTKSKFMASIKANEKVNDKGWLLEQLMKI